MSAPTTHLVARPRGRWHLYTGPLTPSGRFIPRAARTVCRARTRRLSVVTPPPSSLQRQGRMCARCSAHLARSLDQVGRAHPRTRGEWVARLAGLGPMEIAAALLAATTPDQVDAAAHASLVVLDAADCYAPVLAGQSIHQVLVEARHRVRGYPEERYTRAEQQREVLAAGIEAAERNRRAYITDARRDRERRIGALGFDAANPTPRPRPVRHRAS